MIVETRLRYRADVRLPRARKVRKAFVQGDVSIRLREIHSSEAPVVMRPLLWSGTRRRNDVRFHDGLLWRIPIREPEEGYTIDTSVAASIRAFVRDTGMDGHSLSSSRGNRVDADEAQVVSSQRDAVVAAVQEWADREWLVIYGVPHHRARSPLFARDQVSGAFGKKVAAEGGPVPADHVPCWFAPDHDGIPLRDRLAGLGQQNIHAQTILNHLDIDILRPDLLTLAKSREAENCMPEKMIDAEAKAIGKGTPTERTGLPPYRKLMLVKTLKIAYEAAAKAGADFAGATAAVRAAIDMGKPGLRDPRAVVMPAPADALRGTMEVSFHGREPSNQKIKLRSGAEMIAVEPVVLERASLTEVALSQSHEIYMVDGSGNFWIDPNPPSGFEEWGPDHALQTTATLNQRAHGLTERGNLYGSEQQNHFGNSLRHWEGVDKVETNFERKAILKEFAFHRLAFVDGRAFMRCPEPVIVVETDYDTTKRIRPRISHSLGYRTFPGEQAPFLFRLDQKDEAMAFAAGCGTCDDTALQGTWVYDRTRLSFDSALWNLRAATKRILWNLGGRVLLMEGDVATAVARLDDHLEAWSRDTALVSGDEAVDAFVADAGLLVDAIQNPLMEDVGADHVREIARTSLERVLIEKRSIEIEPAEDFGGFSM